MARKLLIVESPAKARTIKKYLDKDFSVKASVGHIRDLPTRGLGVAVEAGFEPTYVVSKGKGEVIKELKKAAAKVREIYLGPDPDREGEAIAWHIREVLRGGEDQAFFRVSFHEITKEAVRQALASPQTLNQDRFESQQARRILDRLVGYNISPLLWEKVRRGLSAGRVQSVALRLLVEREREIRAFVPEEYWSLTATLAADSPPPFQAKLAKIGERKADLKDGQAAQEAASAVRRADFIVAEVSQRTLKPRPLPPFITSTLTQEAFSKLGFPAAKTMRLAQRLYEGVELGQEGAVGLITYMRTDSTRIIPQAIAQVRAYIAEAFGKEYLPAQPHFFKSPRGAQEAHEAIRPTSARRTPEAVKKHLGGEMASLYELIWRRFVASQMANAVVDQTGVEIIAAKHLFRASGSVLRFEGFRRLWGAEDKEESRLPDLKKGQTLKLLELTPKQHFTQPPPRYTDASLVKEMEEKGIGRPSTYAAVLSTLQERSYADRAKGRFIPTELGLVVTDLLVESFPELMDVGFTAQMEAELDKVEEGQAGWRETLERFYGPFSQTLAQARQSMASLKGQGLPTEIKCPDCGSPMVIRMGKAGQFLACTAYPDCKKTSDFTRDESGGIVPVEPKKVEENCPQCGQPMVERAGRYGPFLACSAYPDCKTTKPLADKRKRPPDEPTEEACDKCGAAMVIKTSRQGGRFLACSAYPKCKNAKPLPTGVACPKEGCGGQLAERRSKKGRIFYGCTNYPGCKFISWQRPVPKACPVCRHPYLVRQELKAGPILACPAKGCSHQEAADA